MLIRGEKIAPTCYKQFTCLKKKKEYEILESWLEIPSDNWISNCLEDEADTTSDLLHYKKKILEMLILSACKNQHLLRNSLKRQEHLSFEKAHKKYIIPSVSVLPDHFT